MRPAAAAGLFVATVFGTAAAFAADSREIAVSAKPIEIFRGAAPGDPVDGLIWRGGVELYAADPDFGGLSDIAFTGPNGEVVLVSDAGHFVSGRLIADERGSPVAFAGGQIAGILQSRGEDLPTPFSRDAEAADTILRNGVPAAIRVGFENLTRVADFELVDGRPTGAARDIAIPDWLSRTRTNETLEAVCIATPASPVAGSTLLITERVESNDGTSAAWLLGRLDRGPVYVTRSPGLSPTACAFGPRGELYVLERGIALFSFRMQLRRIEAADVVPGATLLGEVLLSAAGGEIDNMEGLAARTGPDGTTWLTIVSDDNFNDWERTLLLQFSVPD
ncbi:MAG TPA: esterase-like activity of phytase family protein [Devosiaceae bacterium]|nr:esterase-like activity of phytase family protein [Devosiaceae bacterium]